MQMTVFPHRLMETVIQHPAIFNYPFHISLDTQTDGEQETGASSNLPDEERGGGVHGPSVHSGITLRPPTGVGLGHIASEGSLNGGQETGASSNLPDEERGGGVHGPSVHSGITLRPPTGVGLGHIASEGSLNGGAFAEKPKKNKKKRKRERRIPVVQFPLNKEEKKRFCKQKRGKRECGHEALHNLSIGSPGPIVTIEQLYASAEALTTANDGREAYGGKKEHGNFSFHTIQAAVQALHRDKFNFYKVKGGGSGFNVLAGMTSGRFLVKIEYLDVAGAAWDQHWIAVVEIRGVMVMVDSTRNSHLVLSESALRLCCSGGGEVLEVYELKDIDEDKKKTEMHQEEMEPITNEQHLSLFKGTGSFDKVTSNDFGYDVTSLDYDPKSKANYIQDIMHTTITNDFKPAYFKLITASPDCTVWSSLKSSRIGQKRKNGGIFTREMLEHDIDTIGKPMVDKTLSLLEYFKPPYYFIENPQTGRMKDYMHTKKLFKQPIPYHDVDYCCYGFDYRKRTRIWTNIPNFVPKKCQGKGVCPAMDGTKHKRTFGGSKTNLTKDVTHRVPHDLIHELMSCIPK
jgi:hypothetical protein